MTVPPSSVTVSHLVIVAVPTPDGATLEMVTVPEALAVHWSLSFKVASAGHSLGMAMVVGG